MKKTEKIIIVFIFLITLLACATRPQEKPVQLTNNLTNFNLVDSTIHNLGFFN